MPDKINIERLVDSLATISDIIFERLQTMECNKCQPCGPDMMRALKTLREMRNIQTPRRES